jgi:hypothetical protein
VSIEFPTGNITAASVTNSSTVMVVYNFYLSSEIGAITIELRPGDGVIHASAHSVDVPSAKLVCAATSIGVYF